MKSILKITLVHFLLFTSLIYAQQEVIYNGKSFKKPEVLEVQIGNSGKTISFNIAEHDMSPNGSWAKEVKRLQKLGEIPNPEDAPKGLSLNVSVYLKNGFPFPIKPTDSVAISLSKIKCDLKNDRLVKGQIDKIDTKTTETEGKTLHSKKISIEEKARQIAQKMQSGELSSTEAMQQIEALTKPMLAEVESSYSYNIKIEEEEEKSYYGILFDDSNENIEANIILGTLYIKEFNKNKLVAYISGEHIVECTDVARQNSATKICKQVDSKLIPGQKVLKEEKIFLTIDSTFNKFYDNRN